MNDKERRIQILDIVVVIVLFIVGCIAGKLVMTHISDTWVAFNGPAIGVIAIGELLWWRARKKILKKWEED